MTTEHAELQMLIETRLRAAARAEAATSDAEPRFDQLHSVLPAPSTRPARGSL